MLLSKLLAEITTVDPKLDCDISGLTADSRKIEPGFLFVALTGDVFDGHDYIAAATTAGAGAIICEREDIVRKDWQVPVMAISNLRQKVGMVAACFYGYPSRSMTVVGVTGTNGKTSVTQFLAAALEMSDISCGIIGTLGVGFPDRLNLGRHTTPDPISLQHELAEFREAGAKVVAMEVSSHALAQGRINGIDITIAVFTNLTRDHLDYHGNMGNYAETKKSLFLRPELQYAVINADDGFGKKLLTEAAPNKAEFFAYSLAAAHTTVPTLRAEDIQLTAKGITAQIVTPWSEGRLLSNLLGRFNVSNLLAVLAVLNLLEVPFSEALTNLGDLKTVAGRMQCCGGGKKPLVVIDYAHTPDALEKALTGLREHCTGTLWCVFGCGGDRDRGKRALMGGIAEKQSDQLVITDDNPRTEDAERIIEDIMGGLLCPWAAEIEHDRGAAIAHAIECAGANDIVLVAGKGHEPYQIIGTERIPFSDLEHVEQGLGK